MGQQVIIQVTNLHVEVEESNILQGLNLTVKGGEVHAVMGPNGSGKSTLSYVLSGHPSYHITRGSIAFCGQDLRDMSPEDRARMGMFLALQYPVEIPGVAGTTFLKTAYNTLRKARGEDEVDAAKFLEVVREKQKKLSIADDMVRRPLNVSFSGGEKKRFEMLQFALFEPKFAILDETDSGLDIDALKIVSNTINKMRSSNRSMLLITHYQRLLEYVEPDFVHVLYGGRIVQSGDKELAKNLEREGYSKIAEAT